MELTRTVPRFRVHTSHCRALDWSAAYGYLSHSSQVSGADSAMSLKSAQHGPVNRSLTYESTALNIFASLQVQKGDYA
jgi:hypothetical protein